MSRSQTPDPEEYVRRNRDTLIDVVVHGSDKFARALALAALFKYGDERDVDQLRREVDDFEDINGRGLV